MPTTDFLPIKSLKIDLTNYRTVKQKNELGAAEAIIAIKPEKFWAIMESLLDSGYIPLENILILKSDGVRSSYGVIEGNRRVAALKILHGLIPSASLSIPSHIAAKLAATTAPWKKSTLKVPCTIYEASEADAAHRIRSMTHGKAEKAGRDHWTSVARARHNREENGATESALDVLEKYLEVGKTQTKQQSQRWSGDYPLTVLDEAIKKLAGRFECETSTQLAKTYPKIKHRDKFENIVRDIGLDLITFPDLRNDSVADKYDLPVSVLAQPKVSATGNSKNNNSGSSSADGGFNAPNGNKSAAANKGKPAASIAIDDPRYISRTLKKFVPRGSNREKVVSLLDEIKTLKLDKNPIAFCLLLRSMFEISAKAYCIDHKADGLSVTKGGVDRNLLEVLKDVTKHLTSSNQDKEATKRLHGALVEMAKPAGILSVTSLNQLIHNPKFKLSSSDIPTVFGNIFPLLEALNS